MTTQIEPYRADHLEPVVALSLRAWGPVFASLERVMDPAVFLAFYPDWKESQAKAVKHVCESGEMPVWVAGGEEGVAGFVALKTDSESRTGEIYMIAVDPAHQGRGIGLALTEFAVEQLKAAGMTVAMVETGGDPGHAPARGLYEKAGFGLLPVARYFMKL